MNLRQEFANPKKECTPFTEDGGCQSLMAESFTGSM